MLKIQPKDMTNEKIKYNTPIDLLKIANRLFEKLESGEVTIRQLSLGTLPIWRNGLREHFELE